MPTYTTPGVHYERVDASAPAIAILRTDVAGFVGLARRGPLDLPVPVQSWRQFQAYFGEVSGAAFLAYAVRAFFENGGRRCWVVRVAAREGAGGAATAGLTLYDVAGDPVWRVSACSPGVWGGDLTVLVREVRRAQTVTIPNGEPPATSTVASTAGFTRATLVRLTQGSAEQWRVVSDVDAVAGRLVWLHPDPAARLPYDRPLDYGRSANGFDASQPITVQSVAYTLVIRERGRLLAQFEALSLIPEHPQYGPRLLAPLTVPSGREPLAMVPAAPLPIVVDEQRDVAAWQATRLVPLAPLQFAARTTLQAVLDSARIQLASVGGLRAGMVVELHDPLASGAVVGPPLSILFVDAASGNLVTLAGAGLTPAQHAAHAAALGAGTHLVVRAVGGVPTELPLEGGADGLASLTADDLIGEATSPLERDELQARKRRGIRALELVDEVAIVAVPDVHIQPVEPPRRAPLPVREPDPCLPAPVAPAPPRAPVADEQPPRFSEADVYRVQAALVQHCEARRDRIALLDPPVEAARDARTGLALVRAWRSRFDSTYAAFYYPWLRVVDPMRSGTELTRAIPPSGHVAGQYAQTDLTVGVHKAPANAPLVWAEDVTVLVDEAVHGVLNPLGINVIRPLPARGLRILGARTVSSDADWRFVNVRRLLMMIEKAIDLSTQWVVFEPNDVYTRSKLTLALTSLLLALWQRGALAGASPQEAFFVRCDESNNPPDQRAAGSLLAEVGVAPAYPFEFVVLRVGRTGNELEIAELPRGGGMAWPS